MMRAWAPALIFLLLAPGWSAAQEVAVSGMHVWTNHAELRDPQGLGVRLAVSRLRLEYGFLWSRSERTSVVCAGLVSPDAICAPEPASHRASLHGVGVGLAVPVASTAWGSMSLVPGVSVNRAAARVQGASSGKSLSSREGLMGVSLGAELVTRPIAALPLRLLVGPRADLLFPPRAHRVADGYDPFARGILLARLQLGLLLGAPR